MKRLGPALKQLLPDARSLGGEGRHVDRGRLVTVLHKLGSTLRRDYILRLGLIALLIVLLATLSLRFIDSPPVLYALDAGLSILLAAAVFTLKQVNDELARVNLLLALSSEVSLESLTEIARRVAELY